jgi:hypothetical protein
MNSAPAGHVCKCQKVDEVIFVGSCFSFLRVVVHAIVYVAPIFRAGQSMDMCRLTCRGAAVRSDIRGKYAVEDTFVYL